MNPLSAFSLACGIIEVVDVSIKVAKKCRELYRHGFLSEDKEIEEMANHIMELCTDLDLSDKSGQDEIFELGSNCSNTAQELVAEVQKFRVNGPNRKRQVIRKTAKTLMKKSAVEDIMKRLEKYEKVLDSRILVDLRFVRPSWSLDV